MTDHLKEARNGNQSKVYRAIRKYEITRKDFEIIEDNILTKEEADTREIYWINFYNSFKKGYNSTLGGDVGNNGLLKGDASPLAKFTNEEVLEIRKIKYSCKYSYNEVYAKYSDRCSEGCFHKIWNYYTYTEIGKEYNTPEVVNYYIHNKIISGSNNKRCMFSKDDIVIIRNLHFVDAMQIKDIVKQYNCNKSTIERILNGKTYQDIPFPEPSFIYKRDFKKYSNSDLQNLVNDFRNSNLDMKNYYLQNVKNIDSNIFSRYSLSGFVTQLKKGLIIY